MDGENRQDRVVSDKERARAMLDQLRGVHALDVGRDMVIAAVNFSYPKLGLSDETRPVRDLGDVRLSIELVRGILEVLDREHADKTADLHDTLAQMQLAYAHAVQLAGAEREAAHRGEEPAGPAPAEEAPEQPAAEEPLAGDETSAGAEPAATRGEETAAGDAGAPPREPAAERLAARRRTAAGGAAAKRPAAKKNSAAGDAATKRPAAKKKPAATKKPAAKKKPAPRKKPAGEG
jgi:hypothetical protein